MAINFTNNASLSGPLISCEIRETNSSSWLEFPGAKQVDMRVETIVRRDARGLVLTSGDTLTIATGVGAGVGQSVIVSVHTKDVAAIVEILRHADVQNVSNITTAETNFANSMQLRWKINTGVNTNNFRALQFTARPVIPGVGYATSDWITFGDSQLQGKAKRPKTYRLPFMVMFNRDATRFNTASNSTAGLAWSFSNS